MCKVSGHDTQHNRAIPSFDFAKEDYDSLNHFLCSSDFSPCFESSDIEHIWTFISGLIKDGIKQLSVIVITSRSGLILLLGTTQTVFELYDINITNTLPSRMNPSLLTWKTCCKPRSVVTRLIMNLTWSPTFLTTTQRLQVHPQPSSIPHSVHHESCSVWFYAKSVNRSTVTFISTQCIFIL